MDLWTFSPVVFAAGLALIYSKWFAARIVGAGIAVVALAIAWDPGDVDNWYMAIFLAGVGGTLLFVVTPRWLCAVTDKAESPVPSRWLQFNLRRLLAFVAFVSVVCAIAAFRVREDRQFWTPIDRSWSMGTANVVLTQNGNQRGASAVGRWPEAGDNLWIRFQIVLSQGGVDDKFLIGGSQKLATFQSTGVSDYSGAELPAWAKSGRYWAVFDYEIWDGRPGEGRLLKKDSVFSQPNKP